MIEDSEGETRATPAQPVQNQPIPARNEPLHDSPSAELEDLRRWLKQTKEAEELKFLRGIRQRYEQGDLTAIEAVPNVEGGTTRRPPIPSGSLPRPEPPHVFKKKDRADYNRWERDCEGYFIRAPTSFLQEQQKVDFGVMYISETLKTLWRSQYTEESMLLGWTPTWDDLKRVMLNSLGTPEERRQMAYEQLTKAKQRTGQSPTELLDYLRPMWEELGHTYSPQLQLMSYMAALSADVRDDIEKLPPTMRNTLPLVEEQANIVYRRMAVRKPSRLGIPKDREQKSKDTPSEPTGASKNPRGKKRHRLDKSKPNRAEKGLNGPAAPTPTCWNCGQAGHKKPDCTNEKVPGSDPREQTSGKDKGQKK